MRVADGACARGRRADVGRVAWAGAAMALTLVLGGCLEQQGRAGDARQAVAHEARTETGRAMREARGNPVITASLPPGAENIEDFLKRLKRETRQRRVEAARMREQVAGYKEAVRDAREQVARYRMDMARIQEEIRKERMEIARYREEMEALRREIVELAAGIRKDRDFIRRLASDADEVKREMARIREGVMRMRDDMLPGGATEQATDEATARAGEHGVLPPGARADALAGADDAMDDAVAEKKTGPTRGH